VKKPRLVLSDAAVADILEQTYWYMGQSGTALAKRWVTAVTTAVLRILGNPAAGTRCNFRAIELRDVRRATVPRFPKHLIFYMLQNAEVFILRVVHGARDLENLL
jgi:toxin ParE1/3/4